MEENQEKKFEEVKPNLWVRKTNSGKWVQFYPIKKDPNLPYYKNNINYKNLFFGGTVPTWLVFVILLILIFAYREDVKAYKDYYEKSQMYLINYTKAICTPDLQEKGSCINNSNFNFSPNNSFLVKR